MNWQHIVTITLLTLTLSFQVWNLWKYGATNGALVTRITMLIITGSFLVHTVRLMTDSQHGYFFMSGVAALLFLFTKDYFK